MAAQRSFDSASGGHTATGSLGEALYRFPTTVAQQSFWYLDRIEPGNPCWNIAVRFRITGDLDLAVLQQAINEIVRRHEVLRTTFELHEGLPCQIVHSAPSISVPMDDISRLPGAEREHAEECHTVREAALRFDLKNGPLIRVRVLRLAPREHMLLVTIHHIVSDGWSIGVFTDELAANYEDFLAQRPLRARPLPFQYADYAIWKNEQERSLAAQHRAYWQAKLANLPNCEIPTDHPRNPANRQRGYILSTLLPTPLTDHLLAFSRGRSCTLYTTCLSALKILIAYYIQQNDIYLGTLVAGRDRPELEPLIGLFINTLILRTDLSGDPSFTELLARVQQTVQEGLAHQDLPFQQVAEALRLKRDVTRPTLYSINFIYQRDFVKPVEFGGLSMTPVPSKSPGAIYDLNFFMVQRADGWRLSCEYNYDLYEAASVNRMLGQFRSLLEQIADHPNRRISEFVVPDNVGGPLPPFTPKSAQHELSGGSSQMHPETEPRRSFTFKKILSRVYTQSGKR